MSPQGTAAYDGLTDLPPLVERAVDLARRLGFASSGRPEGGGYPPDPEELLKPGGTVVIDDLTPAAAWPPRFGGQVDQARIHWLTHPAVDAAELRLAPDLAALAAPAASLLANGAS
jgi:hypothetical protein